MIKRDKLGGCLILALLALEVSTESPYTFENPNQEDTSYNEIGRRQGLLHQGHQGYYDRSYYEKQQYADSLLERQDAAAGMLALMGPALALGAGIANFAFAAAETSSNQNQINNLESQLNSMRTEMAALSTSLDRTRAVLAPVCMDVMTVAAGSDATANALETVAQTGANGANAATNANALLALVQNMAATTSCTL